MRSLELGIAWRYLRSRSGSRILSFNSVIAIGGVVVGVSALIVIIGVMNGLQNDLREKILIGSPDLRVLTFGDDLKMADSLWPKALEKVRQFPGIVAAAPFVTTRALITAGRDYNDGVEVVGIEPSSRTSQDVTSIREHAAKGSDFRFATHDGTPGMVLGRRIAERLNVYPGDFVTLVGTGGSQLSPITGSIVPRFMRFEVTGIFETGMYEYDNSYVYIPLRTAQEFAGLGGAVTGIEARTTDRWHARDVASALNNALGYPFRTSDWQNQNSSLFQALKLEKLGMGVILLLIVVVAAFNIVGTLTMVVKDKTREIGILKAMGMTGASIRRIFFAQGLVIGLVGTGLGVGIGIAAAMAVDRGRFIKLDPSVYFIDHLPVTIQVLDVSLIVVASIAIAVLATLYPSRQAARLYPVEAIRHE
jgi:lipoprotein-releasing system permease protein